MPDTCRHCGHPVDSWTADKCQHCGSKMATLAMTAWKLTWLALVLGFVWLLLDTLAPLFK